MYFLSGTMMIYSHAHTHRTAFIPPPKNFSLLRNFLSLSLSFFLSLGAVKKNGWMIDVARAPIQEGEKDAISDSSSARAALALPPNRFFSLFFFFCSFEIHFKFVPREKILLYYIYLFKKKVVGVRERTKTAPSLTFLWNIHNFSANLFPQRLFSSLSLGARKDWTGHLYPCSPETHFFFSAIFSLSLSGPGEKNEKNKDVVCPDSGG